MTTEEAIEINYSVGLMITILDRHFPHPAASISKKIKELREDLMKLRIGIADYLLEHMEEI
jgi:hypothetical protein